jgi:hypothetical protein
MPMTAPIAVADKSVVKITDHSPCKAGSSTWHL